MAAGWIGSPRSPSWSGSSPTWSAEDVKRYVDAIRAVFPDAQFGAVETANHDVQEVVAGGRPDRVILQSWNPHPERLLPESDPTTFTGLINRYLRDRTALTLEGEPGSLALTGALTDSQGAPLAGEIVELSLTPLAGPGLITEYTMSGTVPQGTVQADVGYRVNTECDCSGPSKFTLYEVRYAEVAGGANLVPNSSFANGLAGWGAWGTGSDEAPPSDIGSGFIGNRSLGGGSKALKFEFTEDAEPGGYDLQVQLDPGCQLSGGG